MVTGFFDLSLGASLHSPQHSSRDFAQEGILRRRQATKETTQDNTHCHTQRRRRSHQEQQDHSGEPIPHLGRTTVVAEGLFGKKHSPLETHWKHKSPKPKEQTQDNDDDADQLWYDNIVGFHPFDKLVPETLVSPRMEFPDTRHEAR